MKQTPSQTVGPYFAYGLTPQQYNYDFRMFKDGNLVDPLSTPDAIAITGRVLDANGDSIPDAMVELWQNDGENALFGRYGTGTDPKHRFIFNTIKPKSLDDNAPFVTAIVFMRGQLIHSYTRIYFPEDSELHEKDAVLEQIPTERKLTLIAQKTGENSYVFDIHMQGENETVFFDFLTKSEE
ncbi:protocatechuate 3,4-dioxygenase alpha subunit [Chryseobacterium rhizosphaerae]|uniref:protocatechuate 3,4-dioxygenase subunit alpha n=1 Tax=Chryseobacterium rhizosphaerae TaxID=395937 RepID=UPI00285A4E07|nr:protocatechuate 3,4-dioxygenase subunit alpha [Chryseobacterium rhizosphaerae]MDR6548157.1 protocatechuate 3,4-dioxygenase alpha subunit [Chryseobacterium rhizosphaerae]